jgi:putative membrane protein
MTAPRAPFADNRFLQIVVSCYFVLWLVLAIHPVDRGDWFLENLLVFITATVLGLTYRKFQFSNLSYALIAVFLVLHAIGAHYTYAKVPAGFWLKDLLHLKRNHYDRVIHFGFGFLLVYPMRELLRRSGRAREAWAPWLAAAAIVSLSSFFEILEAIIAQLVRPDLGAAYLGTQSDIWDAQKDMAAAFFGVILSVIGLSLWHRKMDH